MRGVLLLLLATGTLVGQPTRPATPMNTIAEQYVKLVLAVGQHDADYVDAFYGPDEWKADAARRKVALGDIEATATRLGRAAAKGVVRRPGGR